MSKISDCCGANNTGNGDTDYAEFGICPRCKEHCDFIDEDDLDDVSIVSANEAQAITANSIKFLTLDEVDAGIRMMAEKGHNFWVNDKKRFTKSLLECLTELGYTIVDSENVQTISVNW